MNIFPTNKGALIPGAEFDFHVDRAPLFNLKIENHYWEKNIPEIYYWVTGQSFTIDKNIAGFLEQLFLYLNGDSRCKYDLSKGIMLTGSIGTGKTTLMRVMAEVIRRNTPREKTVFEVNAHNVHQFYTQAEVFIRHFKTGELKRVSHYPKVPMFIDDLGMEAALYKHYGTELKPVEQLITERYNNNGPTWGTTNFDREDLKYNTYIKDRLKEIFTWVPLIGPSKRKS